MTTTPRQSTEPTGLAPSSGAPEPAQESAQDTALLSELADVLHQVRRGRFDVRLPRRAGSAGEVVDQVNDLVGLLERRNRDILRISRTVGREGRMSERLNEEAYDGAWAHGVQAVNALIDDLAAPTA